MSIYINKIGRKFIIMSMFVLFILMEAPSFSMLVENSNPKSIAMGGAHVAILDQNAAIQNPAAMGLASIHSYFLFNYLSNCVNDYGNNDYDFCNYLFKELILVYEFPKINYVSADYSTMLQYNLNKGNGINGYAIQDHGYMNGSFSQNLSFDMGKFVHSSPMTGIGLGVGFYKKFFAYYASQIGQKDSKDKKGNISKDQINNNLFYAKDSYGIPISAVFGNILTVSIGMVPKLDFIIVHTNHSQEQFIPKCSNNVCSVSSLNMGRYDAGHAYVKPNMDSGAIIAVGKDFAYMSTGIQIHNIFDQTFHYKNITVPYKPYTTWGVAAGLFGITAAWDWDLQKWDAPYSNMGTFQQNQRWQNVGLNFWNFFMWGSSYNTVTRRRSYSLGVNVSAWSFGTEWNGDNGFVLSTSWKLNGDL